MKHHSIELFILSACIVVVQGLRYNSRSDSSTQNRTAVFGDRLNRDNRQYTNIENHPGDYPSQYFDEPFKPKRRRKQKQSTTTVRYDYDDLYKDYKAESSNGYEEYFKNPYIGNVGKIFNQKDLNDYYLKGNHDYTKLVKDVLKQGYDASNKDKDYKYTTGSEDSYKTILDFNKKEASKGFVPMTSTSWGNLKSYDHFKNTFGDMKGGWYAEPIKPTSPSTDSYDYKKPLESSKNYDFGKGSYEPSASSFTQKDALKSYVNNFNFDTKPSESLKNYDFGKGSYDTSASSFTQKDALKNYASNFNFDTKPLTDIAPTRYTIPPYTLGKFTVKNTDYISEFDMKGNPISQFPESSSGFSSFDKGVLDTTKDYSPDFLKTFYSYNSKQPTETSTSSYYDFNLKPKPDPYFSSYWNKGYASSYDYTPVYENYEDQQLKNSMKYSDSLRENSFGVSSVSSHLGMAQPIIVPVPQPYPIKVPVPKPVAVPIVKEIKVPIEKVVPYPIVKNVPYPIEKHIPVPVEKQVPVPVPHLVPVKIPVFRNVYHHSYDEEFSHNHDSHNNHNIHNHNNHNHNDHNNHNHNNHNNHNHKKQQPHRRRKNHRGRGRNHDHFHV